MSEVKGYGGFSHVLSKKYLIIHERRLYSETEETNEVGSSDDEKVG